MEYLDDRIMTLSKKQAATHQVYTCHVTHVAADNQTDDTVCNNVFILY